jgi:uncharacterized membrane protein HdeD (DUF308 family)
MNKQKRPNYKPFIPIGITFIGAGVVFMASLNRAIGISLMGIGVVYLILGIRKRKEEE